MSGVPLKPPSRYRDELAEYLRLEYGESDDDPDAVKSSDLRYVGLFVAEELPTYYWAYPRSRGGSSYATVQVYANTYVLGMTPDAPDPATRSTDPAQAPALRTLDMPPPRKVRWWMRRPFGYLFGFAAVFVILWGMFRHVRGVRKATDKLAVLPVAQILPQWVSTMDMKANDSRAELVTAASESQLAEAAQRLGHPLPAAVADFYRISNGVRWHNALRNEPLPPLAELRYGREFEPPLSARLLKHWEEYDREDEEPQSIQVGKDDLKGMFNAEPTLVDFAAADGLVALSRPDEANFLAYAPAALGELPAGSVLEVEGTRATRYEDLAHWLAGQVAMFGSLQRMHERQAPKG